MLLLLALSSLSVALAAPDRVAATLSEGTVIRDIAQDDDGDWIAFVVDGEVRLLSTRTWETSGASQAACTGTPTAVTFLEDSSGTLELFVGCDDGGVGVLALQQGTRTWRLDTGTSSSSGSGGDSGDSGDSGGAGGEDTDTAARDYDFGVGVLGLAAYNGVVYAVVKNANTSGAPVVRSLDPTTSAVNAESVYGIITTQGGFTDVALNPLNGQLYVLHSNDNVSQVTLASGALVGENISLGATGSDIVVYSGFVLIAGGNRGVLQFNAARDIQIVLNDSENMGDVVALGAFDEESGLLVADAERREFLLYALSTNNLSVGPALLDRFPTGVSGAPIELASLEGHVIAATDSGELLVLTERPWVTISTPNSAYGTAASGDTITVTFSSDEGGDWSLRDGGLTGAVLDSGTIEAGGEATATFVVNEGLLSEGINELWVTVTDDDNQTGHDVYEITVDTPPPQVVLTAAGVSWGNEQIQVEFAGITAEDLDHYEIYVSVVSFQAADYAANGTGGPPFWGGGAAIDGVNAVSVPVVLSAAPGETGVATIEGVTNGYTHYVAVRAVDMGGLEGPMSKVISVTPQETYSAAQLAGERGGFCGSPLSASLALSGLGGLLVLTRRRQRPSAAASLLMLGSIGLLGTSAEAQAQDIQGGKARPSLQAEGATVQLGAMSFDDAGLSSAYGESGNLSLWLARSTSLRHILELEGGVGLARATGSLLAADGVSSSGEEARLLILPVTVSGTLRMDFLENQPIVPYVSVGGDYWLWRESWSTERKLLTDDALGGGKYGWHWAVGGQILLDIFDQEQASQLAARRSIQDSYLIFEFRETDIGSQQQEGDGQGLLLSGSVVSLGLRFDR